MYEAGELLNKLIEMREELTEGFNRMDENFNTLITELNSITEIAEGILKK